MPAPSIVTLFTQPALLPVVALLLSTALFLRCLAILPAHRPRPPKRRRGTPTHLLIVLGSGGHTAEMLTLLRDLDTRTYTHRTYVVTSGDAFSAHKAREFERSLQKRSKAADRENRHWDKDRQLLDTSSSPVVTEGCLERTDPAIKELGGYKIVTIPRARRVHQSLLTTPLSALQCFFVCLQVLRSSRPSYPDLIVTNGPGSAVVVILASLLLRFLSIRGADAPGTMRSIYVESWARVRRLSLSGRLLLRLVDRFVVQWDLLDGVGGKAEYLGCLV